VPTSIVLLALVAGWGIYLMVWWRDARKTTSLGRDRMGSFSSGMGSLGDSSTRMPLTISAGSAASLKPRTMADAARRRRMIAVMLGVAAVVSMLAAFVLGPVAVFAHLFADIALLAYCYGCIRRRNLAVEREIKVQMLYPERVTPLRRHEPRTVNA
jgi:hypothetical protein